MLVQFVLKNFKSFKEETVLDMTAVNSYKEHPSNLIDIGRKEKYIRVASIYGANASGKTKLMQAFDVFQRLVRKSIDNPLPNEESIVEKYYKPFKFVESLDNTEFEVTEIIDGAEYRYGFEYNAECIVSEWLYKKNLETNRTSIVFERIENNTEFGASVRKDCNIYKNQVSKDTLVLSFFNKLSLGTDVFKKVYGGIMSTLVVSSDTFEEGWLLNRFLSELIDNDKEELLKFLFAIDTGIKDVYYIENKKDIEFFTVHRGKNGEDYELDLRNESDGTLKSISLFMTARLAIKRNDSMFVDELNVKLHPLLLKFIVDLFYKEDTKAQLIYTTHDTTLMDKRFFRRDQIMFVQKDEYGCSELTALSDFKVRSDASFEKDYLAGVYGGIPNLKDFDFKEGELYGIR